MNLTKRKPAKNNSPWNISRLFLGFSFLAASLVNLFLSVPHPENFQTYAALSWFPFYSRMISSLIVPHAAIFSTLLVLYEYTMGLLILGKGLSVRIGLWGYILFLIGIFPSMGVYTLFNLVLVFLPAALLFKDYDTSLLELVRSWFNK